MSWTHAELCNLAVRWLRIVKGCGVAFAEPRLPGGEQPDAIGWVYVFSHVVECKTSRADLLQDRRKPWRQGADGLGTHRWMMMPLELAEACGDVMAEHFQGWGLLGVSEGPRSARVSVLSVTQRAGRRRSEEAVRAELEATLWALRQRDNPRRTWDKKTGRFGGRS